MYSQFTLKFICSFHFTFILVARNSEVRRFSYPWPGRGVCQLQEGVARRVMDLVQSLEKLRVRPGAVPGLLKLQHSFSTEL